MATIKITILGILLSQLNYDCNYCKILESILVNDQVVDFLHLEDKRRQILYLQKNEYCNQDMVFNNGLKLIYSKIPSDEKNKIFLKNWRTLSDHRYIIELYYPIEGLFITAEIKDDKIVNIETIEK